MTGRYGFRTGNQPSFQSEPSVAKTLRDAGYVTGMAGKWRQMRDTPRDWGFDESLTDPSASGYYWEKTYTKNGEPIERDQPIYYPDVCREFAVDFFRRHRDRPFFFYYPTHLIHNPIVRTPESEAETKDPDALYEDNVAYLDRELGALTSALEQLGLRQRTIIVFAGDNGTAKYGYERGTIGGRQISGMKGDLLEGGSRVPLIASWKGTIRPGGVERDLVDFTDIFPTFCELAAARLPAGMIFDGHSFAPQLRGEPGEPRAWVYVEHNTAPQWYVRNLGWKLTHRGELFDMSDAPFVEKLVNAADASDAAASARGQLQAVLDKLDPVSGKHVAPNEGPKKKSKKKKPKPVAAVPMTGGKCRV
jgi:arylsulfatase A